MPRFSWLLTQKLDTSSLPSRIKALRKVGVPYPEGYENGPAQKELEEQQKKIVENLKTGSIEAEADREIIAALEKLRAERGAVRFLSGTITSPTQRAAIAQFLARFDKIIVLNDLDREVLEEILMTSIDSPYARSRRYFGALGIPLVRGRDFRDSDATTAPGVAIVNETMAARFWPNEDAIGKRFKFFGDNDFTTIIGVAKDSKYNGVAEEPTPFIYQPLLQNYTPQATLHIRAEGDAAPLAGAVRQAPSTRTSRCPSKTKGLATTLSTRNASASPCQSVENRWTRRPCRRSASTTCACWGGSR